MFNEIPNWKLKGLSIARVQVTGRTRPTTNGQLATKVHVDFDSSSITIFDKHLPTAMDAILPRNRTIDYSSWELPSRAHTWVWQYLSKLSESKKTVHNSSDQVHFHDDYVDTVLILWYKVGLVEDWANSAQRLWRQHN